jgi:tRNA (guanine37-N1)-methyltransferase
MEIFIFTLFPEFFDGPLKTSILGRAIKEEKVTVKLVNIRDFTTDKHNTADDRPYGGGPGMVMKIEPIARALEEHGFKKGTSKEKIVLTSARGDMYNQQITRDFSTMKRLAIICGHYEGVDQRVIDSLIDQEIRIGDYVLTGGEQAAIVMTDSIVRLLPGVLGNEESNQNESHDEPGKFGHYQYTRPEKYEDLEVPEVLLSGDHKKIEEWRESTRKKSSNS